MGMDQEKADDIARTMFPDFVLEDAEEKEDAFEYYYQKGHIKIVLIIPKDSDTK